jgi:poly(A) polymerase/tRNA nucleotidyltransferase (CCA-adding enzyme)
MSAPRWQDEITARGELYRVGGSVRDRLLGVVHTVDTDYLVRGIPPAELEALLSRHGRVVFAGRAFGVYKFTPAGEHITCDVVLPRSEVSTGVRHRDFEVRWDWTLPVEADLGRRDFTINAIAERVPDGERIDPFGGAADLEARVLRAIFPRAFVEDPLRILRGARFAGRFGLRVEADTMQWMREAAGLAATVSPERAQEEFSRILAECERPSQSLDLLHRVGALGSWLAELERCAGVAQNEYHPDDVYWHSLKTCDAAPRDRLVVRWAALLHDTGKVDARQTLREEGGERVVFYGHEDVSARHATAVLERLRYPRNFVAACRHLVQEHMFRYAPEWRGSTLRRFMRRIGVEALDDLLRLREADCRSRSLRGELAALDDLRARIAKELQAEATLGVRDLAVDGDDVMREMGIAAGPGVRVVLEELLERVTDDPALNERAVLLDLLRGRGGDGSPGKK